MNTVFQAIGFFIVFGCLVVVGLALIGIVVAAFVVLAVGSLLTVVTCMVIEFVQTWKSTGQY